MFSLTMQAMPTDLTPIQTGKVEDWDAMMDINVKGLVICIAGDYSRYDRAQGRTYH